MPAHRINSDLQQAAESKTGGFKLPLNLFWDDVGGGYLLSFQRGTGATSPDATANQYALGCLTIMVGNAADAQLYVNEGSLASPNFVAQAT